MLSRRLIRVKVLQLLYANRQSGESFSGNTEKELFFSLNKSYELFHFLLLLMVDIVHYAGLRMELGMQKNLPSEDELNPNRRFVENRVILMIADNKVFRKIILENGISWDKHPELIRNLYKMILQSEGYQVHMNNPEDSFDNDKKLVKYILRQLFSTSEDLAQILEEKSIYWNDELEFIISLMIDIVEKVKSINHTFQFPEPYDDSSEDDFAKTLLRKAIMNFDIYQEILDPNIENWYIERLAMIDVLIMHLAIAEFTEFPSIPVKVTLNEYIEIARYYSTEKSGQFINGILDKVISRMKEEHKINKRGKGLIGEN